MSNGESNLRRKLRAAILALGVLALAGFVMAGCGSSDDSTTGSTDGGETSTASITKPELIKQGDEICKQAEDDSEAEAEEFAEENGFTLEDASEEQLEEAVGQVLVPALDRQSEELEALGAPEGDEEQVEAIIVALEDASAEVAEDPSLAIKGEPLKEATQLAEDYGFKVCGEG